MSLSSYNAFHIKRLIGLLILKLTTSESPKAFISYLKALKKVIITSELRQQAASENFESVFFIFPLNIGSSESRAPANRLMKLRIAGVVKTNC